MRVIVSRTGGFAGIRATWEVRIEEQPDRDVWIQLVESIPWDDVPPAPPEPDRYVYLIRCEEREAVLAERQLQGPWRILVERVRSRAREAGRDDHADTGRPGPPREGGPGAHTRR